MPCALSAAVRHQIVEQFAKGSTLIDIAEQYHLSYSTLRRLHGRFKLQGDAGLTPRYHLCGRQSSKADALILRAALWLRRRHADWGAAVIRMILQNRYKQAEVPTERTLQRWFKIHGLAMHANAFVLSKPAWADHVHDIWQIDAKEKLLLASGQRACYLSIVDEKSGSLLKAFVFPPLVYQRGGAQ